MTCRLQWCVKTLFNNPDCSEFVFGISFIVTFSAIQVTSRLEWCSKHEPTEKHLPSQHNTYGIMDCFIRHFQSNTTKLHFQSKKTKLKKIKIQQKSVPCLSHISIGYTYYLIRPKYKSGLSQHYAIIDMTSQVKRVYRQFSCYLWV